MHLAPLCVYINLYIFPLIQRKPIAQLEKPIKILQITDLHYDELYQVGSNAECGEPVCCGPDQGTPADGVEGAGTWGDYRTCDMPWYIVENLMKQVMTHVSNTNIKFYRISLITYGNILMRVIYNYEVKLYLFYAFIFQCR